MLHFGEIPKKFGQLWRKFSKNLAKFGQNLRDFRKKQQNIQQFLTEILRLEPHFSPVDSKAVQRSALCRSRRELSNAYLLAKIGVDDDDDD